MADRLALIVANDVYQNEGLSRLAAPGHDAEALESVLADPQIGRFEVKVIRNQPSEVIRREIGEFFADRRPDDFLLLHFSGHGLKDAAGFLYFAGTDTLPTRLSSTAIPAEYVNQEMLGSRARQIALFLDCCYGGAFAKGAARRGTAADPVDMAGAFPAPVPDGRGRVVITASSSTEYAFEDSQLKRSGERSPSVFTGALVHALRSGEADTGQDGMVDVDELYEYVYARVKAATSHQTPQKRADLHGRLVIGWVPAALRLVPGELPDALVAQLRPQATDRPTGVRELRRILLDEDHQLAAGALEELRRLTGDDSKQISMAAAAALTEAQLKALPGRIDLPPIHRGDPALSHTVQLVGSPLARVFQATTTVRWLRVEQSDPGDPAGAWLRVTVNPAALPDQAGALEGSVTVRNRLGAVEIPVGAESGFGPLWPRAATLTAPRAVWARDWRIAGGLGAVALTAWPLSATSVLTGSSLVGVGYFALRAALLLLGIYYLHRSESRRTLGLGILGASAVYFLADSVELLHSRADVFAWLEFLAVSGLIAGLVVGHWPFSSVPRRLPLRPPTSRRLTGLVLAALAVQLLLLFVSVSVDSYLGVTSYTIGDLAGPLGCAVAVLPMSALCVAVAVGEVTDGDQRTVISWAIAAYYVPELYFLLASLLLGHQYTYIGADVAVVNLTSTWFVLLQAAATGALLFATLTLLQPGALRLGRPNRPESY